MRGDKKAKSGGIHGGKGHSPSSNAEGGGPNTNVVRGPVHVEAGDAPDSVDLLVSDERDLPELKKRVKAHVSAHGGAQ